MPGCLNGNPARHGFRVIRIEATVALPANADRATITEIF